ncbi:Ig-like domain-containing protein [Demequina activiva]|uniref:Uncharacterized protein n=1 Tax=Demequina activiva TaxID=1582364 RepID=A0A919Q0Z5_9MICO|nr:Ig-like domain-containing protein [Demequina activiva]GIG54157.1 hypothetical protein Dac01nite_09090 [Demequina activiva]
MSAVDSGVGRATAARWRLARRIGVGLLVGVVAVGAVVAPGFDEREVEPDNPSVWALQTATGERFARVNTVVSELDTVKDVSSPSDIIQAEDRLLVYSDNLASVTTVDVARPVDIDEAAEGMAATPAGTDVVVHAGDWVAYLTDTGEVLAGQVSSGAAVTPSPIDPYRDVVVGEGEDRPQFRAVAVAVTADGRVAAYSAERRSVFVADLRDGARPEEMALPEGPASEDAQITFAGDRWAVLEPETGLVWIQDLAEPVATSAATGARLQASTDSASSVVVADEFGAISVPLDGTAPARVHGSTELALGEPAQPVAMPGSGVVVGAWLPVGEGPGTLWMSNGTTTTLDYGEGTLGERRSPQLRSNGSRVVLNETRSGWVWAVPSGALLPSSQQWVADEDDVASAPDEEVATQVAEPRAPVAADDSFGVRAGRQVMIPVLLNDHDANEDILTVVPGSAAGLDPSFGTLSTSDDDQAIVVDVAPGATGSATFTYVVSDGTTDDGLQSAPATVTLTIKDLDENSAPVWCGVENCRITWPSPQVAPGGTVSADVLNGWVDPEGDPIYLVSATTDATVGLVAASPEGQVFFQHTNASSTESGAVPVEVTVSDSHGAQASRPLTIAVLGEPQLRVDDVAVTVTAGVTATVDVASQVSGARGPLAVTEAAMGVDDAAAISVAQGLIGFTFAADAPGSYLVDFTVTDGVAETRGVARITVIPPEQERLTTLPLTAFVRAREDATVDVLSAVTNPGGHVLLLSDLTIEPEDGAQLSADVVGHSALRISGETASGQAGPLGVVSYEVSDGSGREEASVRGEITVILLGSDSPTTPLAVDDSITVRVGTQADIAVLANDVGPAGNVIALDADSVESDPGSGLAFPAGTRIRYLAPDQPGVYEIRYAAYVLGYPTQQDTARVVVTVLASDTNQPPTPRTLSGRVASGESVRLPFVGTGIDPDGDTVALQRVETQPASGSARVSSDGQEIVYSADPGFSGQVAFTYSVVDARGQSAVGTVAVGVLAADVDPRPVTYSDYVQAQVGPDRRVLISPLTNDIDLAGGELELIEATPDAAPGSAEHADLAERLVGIEDGRVEMLVGEEPGTYSYVYSVRNQGGSTAIGRIILKAVREPIADVPIVLDTVLTAENREQFETGVDVLTDKVSWGSGDASTLTLSLWGDPQDLTVSGRSISGPLPEMGRLIPFQLDGTNFAGEAVTTYGFLRVPGEEDVRVALKDPFTPPEVDEGASVTFDLLDLIALPEGVEVSIDGDGVTASGNRADSECRFIAGTTLRYTAGEGEPYTDTCLVPVLIAGQDEPTLLPVPIVIIAEIPQPILTGGSLEVSPGDSTTFDLASMVTWPAGAQSRPVEIAHAYSGAMFEVTRSGTELTVSARSREAIPGQADAITVSLPSDPTTPAVSLTLKVGPAPSKLPKGASVVQTCSQASGSSCQVTVVGANGEVNPLPDVPLELVSVSAGGSCPDVTFSLVGSTGIRASWTADAPGAVCDATFAVRDAQGRVSAGDRLGSVSIDLQGFPAGPAEVRQVGFGDGTATLAVSPGGARSSYPSISGFAVYDGNRQVASCDASGTCGQMTGLTNGDQRTYTVRAVNTVGESKAGVSTVAWSYAPPRAITGQSVSPARTSNGAGLQVELRFTVSDPSTREVRITSPTGQPYVHTVRGTGAQPVVTYALGSNSPQDITLTPETSLPLPPVDGAQATGAAVSVRGNGVGSPTIESVNNATYEQTSLDSAQVDVAVTLGGAGSTVGIGVYNGNRCDVQTTGTAAGIYRITVDGLSPFQYQTRTVCAVSTVPSTGPQSFGEAQRDVALLPRRQPPTPVVTSPYSVGTTCAVTGSLACAVNLNSVSQPSFERLGGGESRWVEIRYFEGSASNQSSSTSFPIRDRHNVSAPVWAKWCSVYDASYCGGAVQLTPAGGSPAYAPSVSTEICARLDGGAARFPTPAGPLPAHVLGSWQKFDYNGDPITGSDFSTLASGQLTVSFQGALAGIGAVTFDPIQCQNPAVAPPPEPDPSPEPSP